MTAPAPTTAPQADPAAPVVTPDLIDTTDGQSEDTDPAVRDDQAAADDARDDAAIGREAARYRVRMREAKDALAQAETAHSERVTELENAHAATAAQLDAQRLAVVDMAIRSARFEPDAFRPHLLVALGEGGIGSLVDADTGTLDVTRLVETVRSTAAAFTPKQAAPQPNPQQGNLSATQRGITTWSEAIREGSKRR